MSSRRLPILIVAVFVIAALIAILTSSLWSPLIAPEETGINNNNPSGADAVVQDAMPDLDAEPMLLAVGTFASFDATHSGQGTASIYELPDGGWLLRLENFLVTNQPDQHVVLAVNMPTSATQALDFGYVDLGVIKGNAGSQNYDIPADVDLSRFNAVVISNGTASEHQTAAEITAG